MGLPLSIHIASAMIIMEGAKPSSPAVAKAISTPLLIGAAHRCARGLAALRAGETAAMQEPDI
jgi:hypothetical protein